jgi:hypothetical protein
MPGQHLQRVSDLLHDIANLVQEADEFLAESSLFKSMVKPLPKAKTPGGHSEPFSADRITNRLRKADERVGADSQRKYMLRARRERKQRSRYQASKLTIGKPRKSLGSRFRQR